MNVDIVKKSIQLLLDELAPHKTLTSFEKLDPLKNKARNEIIEIFGNKSDFLADFEDICDRMRATEETGYGDIAPEYYAHQIYTLIERMLFSFTIHSVDDLAARINSTGTMIDSTMEAFNASIQQIQDQAIERLRPGLDDRLTKGLAPIKAESELLKHQLGELRDTQNSQLQELRDLVKPVADFIRKNSAILMNSIEVQGRLKSLESQTPSIMSRLEKLETDKDKAWNKGATVVWIIVTVLGIIVAYYVGLKK